MEEFISRLWPWLWAVLALIFITAEIFTAGFFLFCFGIGAAAAAAAAWFGASLVWQLSTFIGVSGVALLAARPVANRISGNQANQVGIDRVLNKEAVVTLTIDPVKAQGRVRVDREEWLAETVDGSRLPAGAKVVVLGVQGTRLQVRDLGTARLDEALK